MNFLAHAILLFYFSSSTRMILLVRFRITFAEPRARGIVRFHTTPWSTETRWMNRSSTSNTLWFSSALARADFKSFCRTRAAFFRVNWSIFIASPTFFPWMRRATSRVFCGAKRVCLNTALTSINQVSGYDLFSDRFLRPAPVRPE